MKKSKEPSAKSVGQKGKNKIIRSILLVLCSMLYALCIALCVEAKVYIDISSPAFKKLPIAIQEFSGPSGKEISNIIRDDLEFTGLFLYIDRNAYLENPSQPFNPKNWTPIGVEAIVKGSVQEGKELSVTVSLYEVFEGKEIFKKEYKAEKEFIRPLSHAIANDIYYTLTGETGIFRSRISFVAEDKDKIGIYIMDWDGNRITNMGLKGNIILPPRWSRDGTKLIYSAERNRQWGIYLLDFKNILPLILFPKLSIPIYIFTFIFPVFSAIVVFYAINWLNNLLGFENANLFIRYASFENASLWAFIFVAFIPAIFEELAFRGYLFNQLSQVLTPQTTILVSSFLFALMHLSVFSLLWILPFGIVLGYLRNKYNTLWLGIIIHFIHNSIMLYVDIQS